MGIICVAYIFRAAKVHAFAYVWQITKKCALRVCAQTCSTFYPLQRAIPGRHVSHSEHVSLQKDRSRVLIPCPTRSVARGCRTGRRLRPRLWPATLLRWTDSSKGLPGLVPGETFSPSCNRDRHDEDWPLMQITSPRSERPCW